MKKNSLKINNNIDLIDILKIIWEGKNKIVLITIITSLIVFGSIDQKKKINSFKNSLIIKPYKNLEFLKINTILEILDNLDVNNYKILNSNLNNKLPLNKLILDRFLTELMDYEELIKILKKNEKVKKDILPLSRANQNKKLFNYAKRLTVKKIEGDNFNYELSFEWHNINEAINILDQAINLTLTNLEITLYKDLKDMLVIELQKIQNQNLKRIDYLEEQSAIARELNISENRMFFDLSNINPKDLGNIFPNDDYYLRGYKAIEKEISLIKTRDYRDFNLVKKYITQLSKTDVKWVDYNIFLLESALLIEPLTQTLKYRVIISILTGLIIGLFYVFISKLIISLKVSKKLRN